MLMGQDLDEWSQTGSSLDTEGFSWPSHDKEPGHKWMRTERRIFIYRGLVSLYETKMSGDVLTSMTNMELCCLRPTTSQHRILFHHALNLQMP